MTYYPESQIELIKEIAQEIVEDEFLIGIEKVLSAAPEANNPDNQYGINGFHTMLIERGVL
jgi:hypothetical protein